MTDNELIIVLRNALVTGLTSIGYNDPTVLQNYQPSQQGTRNGEVWYIHRIATHKYGHAGIKRVLNTGNDNFDVTETRVLERTFQITTLKKTDGTDITEKTAYDLAEEAAAVIESFAFRQEIRSHGVSVYRVLDIRSPYFSDDSKQNELSPNFDFTVTYCNQITSTAEPVREITGSLTQV